MEQDLEEEDLEEEEGTVWTVMGRGVGPTFSNEKLLFQTKKRHTSHTWRYKFFWKKSFGKKKNKFVSALRPLVVLVSIDTEYVVLFVVVVASPKIQDATHDRQERKQDVPKSRQNILHLRSSAFRTK